jgi:hypothetical protein
MTLAAPLLALAISALPYPAPRLAQPSAQLKCDRATVVLVDSAKGEMKGTTVAGQVTYRIGPDVQVFGKDGKPAGAATSLTQGTKVRVYYVVDDGAKVQEIDLD